MVLGMAAEIQRRKIIGKSPRQRRIHRGPAVLAVEPLRLQVRCARIVAAHAIEDLEEFFTAVAGHENPLQRMTVRAVEHCALELFGAGGAVQPLGVRHLIGSDRRGLELKIGSCRSARRKRDRIGAIQSIARCPDSELVCTGCKPIRREPVMTFRVAHHRGRDGRSRLFGADKDSLHRPIAIGGDRSREDWRRPDLRRSDLRRALRMQTAYACDQEEKAKRSGDGCAHGVLPFHFFCLRRESAATVVEPMNKSSASAPRASTGFISAASRPSRSSRRDCDAISGAMQLAFSLEHDLFGKPVSTPGSSPRACFSGSCSSSPAAVCAATEHQCFWQQWMLEVFAAALCLDPVARQAARSRFSPSRGIANCRALRYACRYS